MSAKPLLTLPAAALLAAGVWMIVPPAPEPPGPPAPGPGTGGRHFETVRRDIRDITPRSVHRPPRMKTAIIERLPAREPPVVERPPPPIQWPRPAVTSAGLLESRGTRIEIAGISALAPGEQCRQDGSSRWPCGNYARTALRQLIRQRTVECDPSGEVGAGPDGGGEPDRRIVARCRVGGYDIGAWLVAQGWARALPGSDYATLEAEARRDRRGQWAQGE